MPVVDPNDANKALEIQTPDLNNSYEYLDGNCDPQYFYASSGDMVFAVLYGGAPGVSPNYGKARSELRETNPDGSDHSWHPAGAHIMEATLRINDAGPASFASPANHSRGKVIIGQIHEKAPDDDVAAITLYYDNRESPPEIKLAVYYNPSQTLVNGKKNDTYTVVSDVQLEDVIDYQIKLVGTSAGVVTLYTRVTINGGAPNVKTVNMTTAPFSNWADSDVRLYFKAGCYFPDDRTATLTVPLPASTPAQVTFSRLTVNEHDMNLEFALPANPRWDPRWSYGYIEDLNTPDFQPVTVQYNGSYADDSTQIPSWQLSSYQTPAFYWNPADHPVTVGSGAATMASRGIWFYPGDQGEDENFGAIRYTVQPGEAGLYQIKTLVEAVYLTLGDGDTDFHILHNGTAVFDQFVFIGASAAYVHSLVLAEDDTVDFVVGRGLDDDSYGSGLKIWAKMRLIGAPTAPAESHDVQQDFSTANFTSSSRWQYGYSSTPGGAFTAVSVQYNGSYSDNSTQIPSWQYSSYQTPAFYHNTTDDSLTVGGGAVTMPPYGIWFFPGDASPLNYGVIRYKVQSGEAGLYQIGAIAEAVYLSWNTGDSHFHVLTNGVELSRSQPIAAGGSAIYDANIVPLAVGDTVDFVIGRGDDDDSYASGLQLWTEVCRIH